MEACINIATSKKGLLHMIEKTVENVENGENIIYFLIKIKTGSWLSKSLKKKKRNIKIFAVVSYLSAVNFIIYN